MNEEPRHRTKVGRENTGYRHWQASCSCGWVGRHWSYKSSAEIDADEHVRLMAGER